MLCFIFHGFLKKLESIFISLGKSYFCCMSLVLFRPYLPASIFTRFVFVSLTLPRRAANCTACCAFIHSDIKEVSCNITVALHSSAFLDIARYRAISFDSESKVFCIISIVCTISPIEGQLLSLSHLLLLLRVA